MTPDTLLSELEVLPHAARVRHMVELGRAALTDLTIATTLSTLSQGNVYERWMALHSCFGSYQSASVLQALSDPAGHIRALAVRLLPLVCTPEQMQGALPLLSGRLRLLLLWKLHKQGFTALIDAFMETLAAQNDPQLCQLLAFASPDVVIHHIECIRRQSDAVSWQRLARLQPTLAIAELSLSAERAPAGDIRLAWLFNLLLPTLASAPAEQVFPLARAVMQSLEAQQVQLQPLVEHHPAQAAELLLTSQEPIGITFNRVAHRLETSQILALFARHDETLDIDAWGYQLWDALTSEQRLVVYRAYRGQFCDESGYLSISIISRLPAQQREQEARLHLALSELPTLYLPYVQFLPWTEALTSLTPFLRSPDSDLRMLALKTLIETSEYQPHALSAILAILHTHEHDMAPVRFVIFSALVDLPTGIWRSEHLPDLERLIDQALAAIDMPPYFLYSVMQLALVPRFFALPWCVVQFVKVRAQGENHQSYGEMFAGLTVGEMGYFVDALLPLFQRWEAQEDIRAIFALALSFKRHLQEFVVLADILEHQLQQVRDTSLADSLLKLLIEQLPIRAQRLIPELLQEDASWLMCSTMALYVLQHRQDLLTPFLSGTIIAGRFGIAHIHTLLSPYCLPSSYRRRRSGKLVPALCRHFLWAWTFSQQALFAKHLLAIIDEEADSYQLITPYITLIGALPAAPVAALSLLANDPRPPIHASAISALARLESEEGVATLLQALHDERAQLALFALHHFFLTQPVEQSLSLLMQVPRQKVGVAKEVVRLLGELSFEVAYQELLRLERQELHRDVQIALLRALWFHIDRVETWEILERNARSQDSDIALSTVRLKQSPDQRKEAVLRRQSRSGSENSYHIPEKTFIAWKHASQRRLSLHRYTPEVQRRWMTLFSYLLEHPHQVVRSVVLERGLRIASADTENRFLIRLLQSQRSEVSHERMLATNAVFSSCSASDASVVGQALLAEKNNRQVVQLLSRGLWLAQVFGRRKATLPIIYTVLTVLSTVPLTTNLQVDLALLALPTEEIAVLLRRFAEQGMLHADALHLVCTRLQTFTTAEEREKLIVLEQLLVLEQHEHLRRIALAALVAQSQAPHGWNEARSQRLQRYQVDPSPFIAEVAQSLFPGSQEEIEVG